MQTDDTPAVKPKRPLWHTHRSTLRGLCVHSEHSELSRHKLAEQLTVGGVLT